MAMVGRSGAGPAQAPAGVLSVGEPVAAEAVKEVANSFPRSGHAVSDRAGSVSHARTSFAPFGGSAQGIGRSSRSANLRATDSAPLRPGQSPFAFRSFSPTMTTGRPA